MAVRFSAVTVTSDKDQAEFLVSGIPKQSTDLVGWTAFDDLMRKVDCKQDIRVHVAACLYGDGEVFDATPEEVAYFTLRAKADEHFFYNHCKDIEKSDFTIHFIPKYKYTGEKNMGIDFHNTQYGRRFFESQLPSLIKTLNRIADTMEAPPKQEEQTKISDENAARLREIMSDPDKAEAFADALVSEMNSDDEKPSRLGYFLAKSLLENNTEDMLLAVCGWSSESLMNIAEYGQAYPNESQENSDMGMSL